MYFLCVYKFIFRLIDEIRKYGVLIVLGETASGKTTQIPQYVLDAGLNKGKMIAVTQVFMMFYFLSFISYFTCLDSYIRHVFCICNCY